MICYNSNLPKSNDEKMWKEDNVEIIWKNVTV